MFPKCLLSRDIPIQKGWGQVKSCKGKTARGKLLFFVKLRIEIQFDSKNAAGLETKFDPVFILSIFCVISAKKCTLFCCLPGRIRCLLGSHLKPFLKYEAKQEKNTWYEFLLITPYRNQVSSWDLLAAVVIIGEEIAYLLPSDMRDFFSCGLFLEQLTLTQWSAD